MSHAPLLHLEGLQTTNTKLAAALTACGIQLHPQIPVRKITGDLGGRGDQLCYFFQETSPCGHYKTAELVKAWEDKEWHEKNPEHPFAYVKMAFHNFERLTDYAKSNVPIVAVEHGAKVAFLRLDSSDAMQKKVFTKLHSR